LLKGDPTRDEIDDQKKGQVRPMALERKKGRLHHTGRKKTSFTCAASQKGTQGDRERSAGYPIRHPILDALIGGKESLGLHDKKKGRGKSCDGEREKRCKQLAVSLTGGNGSVEDRHPTEACLDGEGRRGYIAEE